MEALGPSIRFRQIRQAFSYRAFKRLSTGQLLDAMRAAKELVIDSRSPSIPRPEMQREDRRGGPCEPPEVVGSHKHFLTKALRCWRGSLVGASVAGSRCRPQLPEGARHDPTRTSRAGGWFARPEFLEGRAHRSRRRSDSPTPTPT